MSTPSSTTSELSAATATTATAIQQASLFTDDRMRERYTRYQKIELLMRVAAVLGFLALLVRVALCIHYGIFWQAGTEATLGLPSPDTSLLALGPLGPLVLILEHPGQLSDKYRPLAGSDNCQPAAELVEKCPAASELRDAILAQGRQLYEYDYQLMVGLYDVQEKEAARQKADAEVAAKKAACARLHRLPV
jgi:hypothetical protein